MQPNGDGNSGRCNSWPPLLDARTLLSHTYHLLAPLLRPPLLPGGGFTMAPFTIDSLLGDYPPTRPGLQSSISGSSSLQSTPCSEPLSNLSDLLFRPFTQPREWQLPPPPPLPPSSTDLPRFPRLSSTLATLLQSPSSSSSSMEKSSNQSSEAPPVSPARTVPTPAPLKFTIENCFLSKPPSSEVAPKLSPTKSPTPPLPPDLPSPSSTTQLPPAPPSTSSRPAKITCPHINCLEVFHTKTKMRKHFKEAHPKESIHRCDTCGRGFTYQSWVEKHQKDGCPKASGSQNSRSKGQTVEMVDKTSISDLDPEPAPPATSTSASFAAFKAAIYSHYLQFIKGTPEETSSSSPFNPDQILAFYLSNMATIQAGSRMVAPTSDFRDGLINLGTDSATSTATSPDTDHQLNEINHGEGRLKHKSEAEEPLHPAKRCRPLPPPDGAVASSMLPLHSYLLPKCIQPPAKRTSENEDTRVSGEIDSSHIVDGRPFLEQISRIITTELQKDSPKRKPDTNGKATLPSNGISVPTSTDDSSSDEDCFPDEPLDLSCHQTTLVTTFAN